MIDKDLFRKTEGRLYRYYRSLTEIDKLEYKISLLEDQKQKIKQDMKETNIFIEEESRSITYEERVQNSSSCSSYAEKEMIRQIEKLERELKDTIRYSLKLKVKVRDIKKEIVDIEYTVRLLGKEYKDLLEMKYRDKKSFEAIGEKLHASKSAAFDKRDEVVEAIAKLLNVRI